MRGVGVSRRPLLWARKLPRAGWAIFPPPDGMMLSSRKPTLRDDPKPQFSPTRSFIAAGVFWHNIKVEERRTHPLLTFDQVKDTTCDHGFV
jgi:hypothetical protein